VCAFDLTQVFILNMTYDIRLKSVSSQLLLLSLFLLAPYARRLFVVLFTDRAIPATESVPLFTGRRANRVALIAQVCVGLVLLAAFGGQGWQQFTRPTPNLYGIWQVDGFSAEGYRRDPLLTGRTPLASSDIRPPFPDVRSRDGDRAAHGRLVRGIRRHDRSDQALHRPRQPDRAGQFRGDAYEDQADLLGGPTPAPTGL
jgi:hypothetical protein